MFPFRLYAATGDAVAQIDSLNGESVAVSRNLEGRGVMCRAVPTDASYLQRQSTTRPSCLDLHDRMRQSIKSRPDRMSGTGSCPISSPGPSPSSSLTSKGDVPGDRSPRVADLPRPSQAVRTPSRHAPTPYRSPY